MEWQAPAIVLESRPHGEGGAVVSVLTEAHGRHAGLARGGASRAQVAIWQPGNLVEARWIARLPEQLGTLSGALAHPSAALALDDPLSLALLASACALAEGCLPEREAHPRCFHELLRLLVRLPAPAEAVVADYVRWETGLLAELGYGLDLARCAVTGATDDLAFVSPRTGRAVSAEAGEAWAERLLPLPRFLLGPERAGANTVVGPQEWLAGLRLTGHFLGKDAYAHGTRPLPAARGLLMDRIAGLALTTGC